MEKTTTSGGNNVSYGSTVSYGVEIKNTGVAPAFLENIIDTIPENMTLSGYSMNYAGSTSPVPNALITQSGSELLLAFNTGGTLGRSELSVDNVTTAGIDESIMQIAYDLTPTQDFVISSGETRENVIA